MKKIYLICVCLLVCFFCLMPSCATHHKLIFSEGYVYRADNNSIEHNGVPILKIDPSVLSLKEKRLTFEKDPLSEVLKKHISSILRECRSSQKDVIAVSSDFIIVRNNNVCGLDTKYMYQFDFESDRWVCAYADTPVNTLSSMESSCSFYRSVYVIKRRNRMIIKDCFGDISVIYVIQGKDHKSPFYTTMIWNPAVFEDFITISNYINAEINPISYNIARNRWVLN